MEDNEWISHVKNTEEIYINKTLTETNASNSGYLNANEPQLKSVNSEHRVTYANSYQKCI